MALAASGRHAVKADSRRFRHARLNEGPSGHRWAGQMSSSLSLRVVLAVMAMGRRAFRQASCATGNRSNDKSVRRRRDGLAAHILGAEMLTSEKIGFLK